MNESFFSPASFFLLRFAYWPYEKAEDLLSRTDWEEYIFDIYDKNALFREAILIASPSLALACRQRKYSKLNTSALSLLNYALRMATRATPFGLFSCVSTAYWEEEGQETKLYIDKKAVYKRARPDMGLIFRMIEDLYNNPKMFKHLFIQFNPLVWRQDHRFFINYLYQTEENFRENKAASIKKSKIIDLIFDLTQKPSEIKNIIEKIKAYIPNISERKLVKLLKNLLTNQFLLPANLPSLFSTNFEDLFQATGFNYKFKDFLQSIKDYNQFLPGEGEEIFTKKLLSFDSKNNSPVQVDSMYTGTPLVFPNEIKEHIVKAAELIWKLSATHSLSNHIDRYREKFLEKYGLYRTVPLLEMLNKERGLGPFFIETSHINHKNNSWENWIRKIREKAFSENKKEIILEDKDFESLFSKFNKKLFDEDFVPPSIDVFVKVIVESPEGLQDGDYLIEIANAGMGGIQTFGRFLDVLGKNTEDKVKQFIKEEEGLEKDSIFLDVSYWPSFIRCANVAISPSLRAYRLDINGNTESIGNIKLEDIYIGATPDRFYLTFQNGLTEINAYTTNRLNISYAPDPLHFMLLITNKKYKDIGQFSLELPADSATFLPRVCYGKTILSPATWNFFFENYSNVSKEKILEYFDEWALRWGLPQKFLWVRGDQFLICDSTHNGLRMQIANKIKLGQKLQFKEFYKHGFVRSEDGTHAAEIVIPLKKRARPLKNTKHIPKSYIHVQPQDRYKLPGSDWLYVKFYIGEEMENIFLLDHFIAFTTQLREDLGIQNWFFVRYKDPMRHLRIRFHLPSVEILNDALSLLNKKGLYWLENGIIQHLMIDSYEREVERYGGVDLMSDIENFFCADSLVATYMLQAFEKKIFNCDRVIFEVLSLVHLIKDLGFSLDEAHSLLKMEEKNKALLKGFRELRAQTSEYIFALFENSGRFRSNDYKIFQEVTQLRFNAIENLLKKADNFSRENFLQITDSLLHMHANRIGCDQEAEYRARLIAFQAFDGLRKFHLHKLAE